MQLRFSTYILANLPQTDIAHVVCTIIGASLSEPHTSVVNGESLEMYYQFGTIP